MDERTALWLVDFILASVTEEERKRITAKAESRYEKIGDRVMENPDLPASTAEKALEYYLNYLVDA